MSMLSSQINELRDKARHLEGYQNGEISRELRKAAYTIESLRDRLQELQGVGGESRYSELFGTPEKAAKTLEAMELDTINWCKDDDGSHRNCGTCPYEYDYYGCYHEDGFSMLEWLESEVRDD